MSINQFDHSITRIVQAWPSWIRPLMLFATLIGQPVIVLLSGGSALLLAIHYGRSQIAWALALGLLTFGFSTLLKTILHRTRPDTLYVTTMRFKSYSFPSGHSFGSLVIFGLLSYLAYQHLSFPWSTLTLLVGTILILIIGLSRIYLGAHFPTDVLGGWLLSAVSLLIIIRIFVPHG